MKLSYSEVKEFKNYVKNYEVSGEDARSFIEELDQRRSDLTKTCLCILATGIYEYEFKNYKKIFFDMPKTRHILEIDYDFDEVVKILKNVPLHEVMIQCW